MTHRAFRLPLTLVVRDSFLLRANLFVSACLERVYSERELNGVEPASIVFLAKICNLDSSAIQLEPLKEIDCLSVAKFVFHNRH